MDLRSRHADKIHQYVGHPYVACPTLRRILHAKIHKEALELPYKKQVVDTNPLPKHKGKEVVAMISCSGDNDVYQP